MNFIINLNICAMEWKNISASLKEKFHLRLLTARKMDIDEQVFVLLSGRKLYIERLIRRQMLDPEALWLLVKQGEFWYRNFPIDTRKKWKKTFLYEYYSRYGFSPQFRAELMALSPEDKQKYGVAWYCQHELEVFGFREADGPILYQKIMRQGNESVIRLFEKRLELLEEMKAYDENSSFLRSLRHFEFDHVLLPKFSCFHCLGIEHKLKEYLPDEVQQEKIWELKDEKLFRMIYELLEEIEIFKKKVFTLS